MHNVAEKLCFIELLERVARLRRFLLVEQRQGDSASREVIGVLLWGVNQMLATLDPLANLLSVDLALSSDERTAAARRLSTTYSYFFDLHLELSQVRGQWVSPEVDVFLQDVLGVMPKGRKPGSVSVVLLNEYSFEEEDFASAVRLLLAAEPIPFSTISDRPTVGLPKTERDNPLYWANLVHECGHIDEEGLDELIDGTSLIPANASREQRETLESWAGEFFCDLFATKILGPAYLASFSAFALITTGLDGGEHGSKTHPPDIVRICLMHRMLKNNEFTVPLAGAFADFGDLSRLFYQVNERRSEIDRVVLALEPPEDAPNLEHLRITEFADEIIERIDTVLGHTRELQASDYQRLPQLAARLADGVLIGSYADQTRIKDALANWGNQGANTHADSDARKAAYLAVKRAIQEQPVLPWEIINAGWLHKVTTIYSMACESFFSGSGAIIDKIEAFDAKLLATDDALLKSLEVSQIHRTFGRTN
jgi:hypothetical protein